jgi:hypothetical protein
MKKVLTILLACTSLLAVAQKRSNLSKSVDDDGKTMSIRVTGTINGREIDYARSFDVAAMSSDERTELREKVMESITAGKMDVPAAPMPVVAPAPPDIPEPPVLYSSNQPKPAFSNARDPHQKAFEGLDAVGYRKHVRYNPESGELFLQYHFKKNDEEFVFEKTVNAAEKSEREREQIIERFEKEIELPGKGMEM